MIKKLAALGIISAIAFAPVVSYAEDAAPAAADAAKTAPMKPMKTTKHKTHKMHKSSMKKAAPIRTKGKKKLEFAVDSISPYVPTTLLPPGPAPGSRLA